MFRPHFSPASLFLPSFVSRFRFRNPAKAARQALIICLIVILSANHSLAAPGFAGAIAGFGQELSLRWYASGWAAAFDLSFFKWSSAQTPKGWDGKGAPPRPRPDPEQQEKREDRERKVSRVKIFPGDHTIEVGQQAVFSAIAYDKDGAPISGLNYEWDGLDEDKNAPVTISQSAAFSSARPGRFKITVDVAGKKDHVKLTVVGAPRDQELKGTPLPPVSSGDKPKPKPNQTSRLAPVGRGDSNVAIIGGTRNPAKPVRRQMRAASAPLSPAPAFQGDPYDYTWNSYNYTTFDDPGTERGDVPGHAVDGGAGSGNFQFAAPVIGLDGRGLDLNLALNYNSRLWHKSGSEMFFDIDRDWIPGWSLGFGKIVVAGNSYMLIDADGTRRPYYGQPYSSFGGQANSLQTFEGYTTDGSFIDYYAEGYQTQFSGGYILRAWAKLPNGTTVDYGASALGAGKTGAIYPKQITDANGNFITITYRLAWDGSTWKEQGPDIETITDSLGRSIQFHYDSNNLLVAISAPGMRDAQNNWQSRTVVRLQYDWKDLNGAGSNYGFSGVTTRVRNSVVPVIRAIYYPATSTGYWFGDADSYSNYGMLRRVSERRAMTCSVGGLDCSNPSAPLNQQPTIGAGSMSREMLYNYPQSGIALNDTPTYTQMTEDWAARDTAAAPVTNYSVVDLGARRVTTITRPNGVRVEQETDDDPNSPFYGLLLEDRTYSAPSGGTLLGKSEVTWEKPNDTPLANYHYNSPRPTRTEVTDERGQVTATNFSYGAYNNQVTDASERGYNDVPLRRAHNEYENGASYRGDWINRGAYWWRPPGQPQSYGPQWSGPHIFNLVKVTEIYAADDTTRVSRVEYEYDQQPPTPLPNLGVATHHTYAPNQRGNVTSIKRYADAATLDQATAITETREYDVCGNVVKVNTACCEQTTFVYLPGTEYAWPSSSTRGSATDATKQNTTTAVYDLNTGLVKETYDANGLRSNVVYLMETLRPEREYGPTGAYAYHIYDDANLIVYDLAYESGQSGGYFASRSDKYLDGHGRVHGEIAYGKDYVMDFVTTKYDNLGRLMQQSRPYRSGDPPMTTYAYDELDRVKTVTAPDGSVVQRFYNQKYPTDPNAPYPSAATQGAAGQTVRAIDPWGRERWARFDEQNRLVEVVEPNPDGTDGSVATGGMKTNYSYDTLGNLTLVTQGSQTRSFKYDSLSRLTHQKLAERDATLNDAGQHVGAGQWSDVFSYDTRSNLVWRVEARGVKTIFSYNNDPLNRLQSVVYDKSGVPANLVGNIPNAPKVDYYYVTSGDKMRLNNYIVDGGMGSETFGYDGYNRLNQVTQTFPGREGKPLVRTYTWDTLDRMQKLTYPMRHGTSDTVRREMTLTYDIASRIDSLKYDDAQTGQVFASNPVYNAASQVESLTVGSPTVGSRLTETYTYDTKTGLLTTQKVTRISDGVDFVDLKYNYTLTNDGQNSGAKTGQLTSITDVQNQARNRAFEYDKLGRLKRVKGGVNAFYSPQWAQIYTYDRYGNRSSVASDQALPPLPSNIPLDGLASLSFNAANNRVTGANGNTNFEHDPAGNQTKAVINAGGAVQKYRYDAAGRLAQVLDANDVVQATYSYGASNQRLMSVEGAITTYYGWDGGQIIAEYAPSGATGLLFQTGYVYLGGRLLATVNAVAGSGTRFHHPDRLGTKVVTDQSNGELVTRQMGMPFGTQQPMGSCGGDNSCQHPTKNNPSKKRFTSYDRSDATGLDYAVNRFYSAAQGRFTQVDPIGMSAASLSDPQTLNLYGYCGNDPINHVDPGGLFFKKLFGWIGKALKWIAIAAAIAVAVISIAFPGAWIANLAIWASKHSILSAILGINTPKFAIINLVAIGTESGAVALGIGAYVLSSVGAVTSLLAQKESQSPSADKTKNRLTDNECANIRKILDREKKWGTAIAAFKSSILTGDGAAANPILPENGGVYNTRFGQLDLEWFAVLSSVGRISQASMGPVPLAGFAPHGTYVTYVGAKNLWTSLRLGLRGLHKLGIVSEYLPITNSIPFGGGEDTAAHLAARYTSFNGIFNDEFMRVNCSPTGK